MKSLNIFSRPCLFVCFALSGTAYAQVNEYSYLQVPSAIGELTSTIRYPAASRTGNYILAWPEDSVVYVDSGSDSYQTDSDLQELQDDGSWKFIGGSGIYIASGKPPGVYKYRLLRTLVEENYSTDQYGEDDDSEDYSHYYEPAIQVIVVGNTQ